MRAEVKQKSFGDRQQRIEELIDICCNPTRSSGNVQPSERSKLSRYATRLADSSIAAISNGDPDALFQTIRQQLLQQHRQDDAARFAELYQQLAMYDGLSINGRYALLGLLQRLTEQGAAAANSIISYKPLQLPKALPIKALTADLHKVSDQQDSGQAQRPRAMQQGGVPSVPHPQQTTTMSDANVVKQLELVRDVLRVVQGLTGRYCNFNPAVAAAANPALTGSALVIAAHDRLKLQVGYRTLIHELGELGLMYRRVLAAIQLGRSPCAGSVRQALCSALSEEVTDFYRLMAVLEAQLETPQPMPGGDSTSEAAGPYLSLRRLQLWLAEPMRRMRFLANLVDGCAGRTGGDLAGRVWAASKVGDPLAVSYATRMLHQMSVPLFDMIRRWVFEGVLEDAACEFFVVPSSSSVGGPDLWREAYRLEPAKLPPFISAELAATILRAGKSINFLRDACSDARWVQQWAPGAAEAAAELGYGQLPVLEREVVSAGRHIDARLMAVLQSSGQLDRHCQAIRRYLLLGQGDFVVALLDCLGPELSKPAKDVSEVTLNHQLRLALLASAGGAQEEGGVQDRLRAGKAQAGNMERGWDVFSLQYQLGPPLNSIFTPAAQASYSRLSRLLWLMRRTERSLGTAWHLLKVEIERGLPRFASDVCRKDLDDLLRSCLRLRAEMAHFNINLQYYINLEVLECAWADFMSASAASPDLDCLIAAHEKFLAVVLARALLGPGRPEGLRRTLTQLLKTCMGLAPLVHRFNENVQAGLIAMEHRAVTAAANTAAGRWGTTASSSEPAVSEEDIAELKHTWAVLAGSFRQQLIEFLRALPGAADEVNAEVRFLMARLNFSDYYTKDDVSSS